jgi:hypothetical protein
VPEDLLDSRTSTIIGPDLFNPPAHQGWITVTPSFTLSAEYNDNLFLSSEGRKSDVSIGLTPGVTLTMRKPEYRLAAGYNTTGQFFLQESDLNGFGEEQNFFADASYQISPRLSFSVGDRFAFGRGTSGLTTGGVSVGFQESWRNTFTPRLGWQATPTTGLELVASHTILRFSEGAEDSDTYRLALGMNRALTPRLTGTLSAGVAYFTFEEQPSAWTYTPTLGFSYAVTPTLRASVAGGPTVIDRDGETAITPSVAVGLTQAFRFGSASVGYDRAVTAETVGISDRQAVFASLDVPTLRRGLQLGLTARYAIVDTDVSGVDGTIKTITLGVRGAYQIARSISVIGSYSFFRQTDQNESSLSRDVDQNRVFLGLQYAFPITIY